MAKMYLDLCLSDIPKELIKTASNGKKYLKAIINPRQQPDSDGYDHYVAAFVPKDQRQQGDRPAFFGRAQEKHYEDLPADNRRPTPRQQPADDGTDGLPF